MSDMGDVIEPDPAAAAARRIGLLAVIFFFSFFPTIACRSKETHPLISHLKLVAVLVLFHPPK